MLEYVLLTALLIAASYGMVRLFAIVWKAKFMLLQLLRTGATGIGP